MESNTTVEVKIDQDRWVVQIKEDLQTNGEEEEEKESCVSVFGVPKELLVVKPEAYVPQCVSIGPYHQWRSDLSEMERYKVAAARRFQKRIAGDFRFESVVSEMKKHERQIRGCYHKFLDYTEEALAWLMALDASFVLECLQFYVKQADQASSHVSSDVKQLGRVLDPYGRSATHNAIMRDLSMLENQIPLFLLQKLLEMQLVSQDKAEERLYNLLSLACDELSPFMFKMPESSRLSIKERAHILEVLYYSIVPAAALDDASSKEVKEEKEALPDTTYVEEALKEGWKAVSSLNIGPVRRLTALPRRLFKLKAVKFLMKLPVRLISILGNLPILRAFKEPLTILFGSSATEKDEKDGDEGSSSVETPPTRDELTIPSVSDLYSAGVKFLPADGDLTTIRFDPTTATLYLPKVKLDANSEVILRNLVAFEASAAPGDLIFTRYTDFMNGMIDKDEDVRLLVKSKIIYNHLANEGKVASLWNGMGKCVKLTKVKYLDQVIADVNKHYNRTWSVAVMEYMNKYIFGSWQCLTFLATAILLILTCLQAFCSVYDCQSWWTDTKFLQG
ncbi:hypothetical protein SUGI_0720100 [Cryptomeria japonica]|uniref:putative UPF0481 protein At3g02645 n=1 Tax=Cryptomeria japonica TaxID=3369 RepID=UPI002414689F|nr:putative UPF0481 protein At3g02645 [Cryptomeria japonica]GLJ35879.1 hypothetical protein SUGI_0720100 [Cryptomeria japonica]